MTARDKLEQIQSKGLFTSQLPFQSFVEQLCKRYTRIHGEILLSEDHEYIVRKLEEQGYLEEDEAEIKDPLFF